MSMPATNTLTFDVVTTGEGPRHLRAVPTASQPAPRLIIDRFDQWDNSSAETYASCCVSYTSCVDLTDELEAVA